MKFHRYSLALAVAATLISAHTVAQTPAATQSPAAAPPPVAAPAAAPAPAPATPAPAAGVEQGKLAWYGRKFAGRRTASGEAYNPDALTMAHKTLPFGTKVKVTNLANKKSVVLRVNDRGPTQADRVGDVSLAAAQRLGMVRGGVIDAELAVVSAPAPKKS
jgi:rare lipoprotein A